MTGTLEVPGTSCRAMTQYSIATWRLLETGWQDGATNMAIDEAILQAVASGHSPPTLRFYGWNPPCLSLGYAQTWSVVDSASCREQGWDVVRRPTGGRAILHIDELTYSVCAPENEPRVHGGVLASYRRLSDALAAGLELLGLNPARAQPVAEDGKARDSSSSNSVLSPLPVHGPVCFDRPSNFEITIGARKLVGSAQARKLDVVLQHGTLPLYGDITRIASALNGDERRRSAIRRRLQESATTLQASLGRHVSYEQVVPPLSQGFAATLNLALETGSLTPWELQQTAAIRAEKYANDNWTRRR